MVDSDDSEALRLLGAPCCVRCNRPMPRDSSGDTSNIVIGDTWTRVRLSEPKMIFARLCQECMSDGTAMRIDRAGNAIAAFRAYEPPRELPVIKKTQSDG